MPIVKIPKILLPKNTDMERWAVVACDQFTAESAYWDELQNFVGDAPSTLRLIYPEIYLKDDIDGRVASINRTMKKYIADGFFTESEGFILVERDTGDEKRVGLIVAIDLECYDWRRIKTPVRATEDTLMERLPVRIRIRKDADIELPHTMLLIDDADKTVIEPLYENRENLEKLYDFELNMGGGNIKGYKVKNSAEVVEKFNALLNSETQIKKYGTDAGILFAVGDGNHSMASAKAMWEDIKKGLSDKEQETHPARFFLAEAVNIYGGGMRFEPIHRVVYGGEDFIEKAEKELSGDGSIAIYCRGKKRYISCPGKASLAISAVQAFLDKEVKKGDIEVDYIHNESRLKAVCDETDGVGIIMPPFPAEELFGFVVNVGNLPKKSFSIGEPERKRYYLEAKYIK